MAYLMEVRWLSRDTNVYSYEQASRSWLAFPRPGETSRETVWQDLLTHTRLPVRVEAESIDGLDDL